MSQESQKQDRTKSRLLLPPDLYTRNEIIASIIDKLKKNVHKRSLSILDVGGRGGQLQEFLSSSSLVVLDIRAPTPSEPPYVVGDITRAPFADNSFDIVVASDVLEHVEPKLRKRFLSEILRLSDGYVILGGPFQSPEVAFAERLVNDLHVSLRDEEHPWLMEHLEYGLPRENELASFLKQRRTSFRRMTTNNLINWTLFQSLLLIAANSGAPRNAIDCVSKFYNLNYRQLGDSAEPTYRKIFVVARKGPIPRNVAYKTKTNMMRVEQFMAKLVSSIASYSRVDEQSSVANLIGIFRAREDLRKSYPEAASGDLENLVNWAADTVLGRRHDGDRRRLQQYGAWYVQAQLKTELEQTKTQLEQTKTEWPKPRVNPAYRFSRFYRSAIDRAFPNGTRRGELKRVGILGLRIASSEGIATLFRLTSAQLRQRRFYGALGVPVARLRPMQLVMPEPPDSEYKQLEARISVIIPTKNPPVDFEQTLERLRRQKGITDLEILLVNSGDRDLTHLVAKYGVALYDIRPETFDHSLTRNYGAQKASGEFILFLTDDAIPARDDLVLNMIRILVRDSSIAAVSARQIPRSDADLMYCQTMWWHYRALGLVADRVVGSNRLDALTPAERRAICQIDDVCSCYRRDTFLRYRYAGGYAEDLELGIRLVRDGFKVAQLFSTGVIHSHNRPPSYYLRRNYVDFKALNRLLDLPIIDFSHWPVRSARDLFDLVLWLLRSVEVAVQDLYASRFCEHNIEKSFLMIRRSVFYTHAGESKPSPVDEDLSTVLSEMAKVLEYSARRREYVQNPLVDHYLGSLDIFREWLLSSHQDLKDIEKAFVDTLYRLFAAVVGHIMCQYVLYARRAGRQTDTVASLDELLSEGV